MAHSNKGERAVSFILNDNRWFWTESSTKAYWNKESIFHHDGNDVIVIRVAMGLLTVSQITDTEGSTPHFTNGISLLPFVSMVPLANIKPFVVRRK
jgi:hypothetical protein